MYKLRNNTKGQISQILEHLYSASILFYYFSFDSLWKDRDNNVFIQTPKMLRIFFQIHLNTSFRSRLRQQVKKSKNLTCSSRLCSISMTDFIRLNRKVTIITWNNSLSSLHMIIQSRKNVKTTISYVYCSVVAKSPWVRSTWHTVLRTTYRLEYTLHRPVNYCRILFTHYPFDLKHNSNMRDSKRYWKKLIIF